MWLLGSDTCGLRMCICNDAKRQVCKKSRAFAHWRELKTVCGIAFGAIECETLVKLRLIAAVCIVSLMVATNLVISSLIRFLVLIIDYLLDKSFSIHTTNTFMYRIFKTIQVPIPVTHVVIPISCSVAMLHNSYSTMFISISSVASYRAPELVVLVVEICWASSVGSEYFSSQYTGLVSILPQV